MTGRAPYRLPDAMWLRTLVACWAAIAVAACATAVWFFIDERPTFGAAWLVLAIGWGCVAFGATRLWGSRPRAR